MDGQQMPSSLALSDKANSTSLSEWFICICHTEVMSFIDNHSPLITHQQLDNANKHVPGMVMQIAADDTCRRHTEYDCQVNHELVAFLLFNRGETSIIVAYVLLLAADIVYVQFFSWLAGHDYLR